MTYTLFTFLFLMVVLVLSVGLTCGFAIAGAYGHAAASGLMAFTAMICIYNLLTEIQE